MKTYLKELTGQVRGNARLRRRLDAKALELIVLRLHVTTLVALLDKLGHGDDRPVAAAARAIGWERMSECERSAIRDALESLK